MAWANVDDQTSLQFVKIVEKFPDIYDNNTDTYRRWCAHRAWDKIVDCVKDEMKIDCTVSELKSRWKCIRSSYSRYKAKLNKSRQDDSLPPKKYYLSDALKYLDPYMKQKSVSGNDPEEEIVFETCFTNEDDSNSNKSDANNIDWTAIELKPDVLTINKSDSQFSETEEPLNINAKRKRLNSDSADADNDSLQFFKSILPDIEHFTVKEKRRLKMGVLKLIDDIENDRN
ncbi:unnamed protein product [Diatraea saccharalis]|uniref:MADF domain-containing protein n=1 Tax=Diatraea saccharalis TaxID=40085 RepID=A0A9N9RCX1_9NEOP|nr:unnamed protein product [Diatraea saccharalis]